MKDLSKKVIEAIERYQVPGCVNDYSEDNIVQDGVGVEWSEHVAGTSVTSPRGLERIYLGMPNGFFRLGKAETPINIFSTWEQKEEKWKYDFLNVPCWKYLDKHGNTIVRGLSPRINAPFLHVILGNHIEKIDCHEITEDNLLGMN